VPTSNDLNNGFRIGDWEILPARGVFRRGEREERPSPIALKLLLALARRDGDLATKDELIAEVWNGVIVGDDSITQAVKQLRFALGDDARHPHYIKTLPKQGYRLLKQVELLDQAQAGQKPDRRANPGLSRNKLLGVAAAVIVTTLIWVFTPRSVQSIGVMPVENQCDDLSRQYVASGLQAELVRSLLQVPEITVKIVRVSYPDREVGEVASLLDVDAVLFAELRCNGDTLKISYRVARAFDEKIVSAGDATDRAADIFLLQYRVANRVRDDLFGESPQELVSASGSPDANAYDRYMRALYMLDRRGRGQPENLQAAIALLEESVEIDPGFGPAYLSLATAYALLPDYYNAPLQEAHARAIEVIERGVEVDPGIADAAAAIYGFVYHKQRRWTLAEEAYLQATTARVVDSNAFNWYSLMLAGVGRLDDALDQVLKARGIDPSSATINTRIGMVYTWLGNSAKASEFFERADALGASGETHMFGKTLVLVRSGELDEAARQFSAGVSLAGGNTDWIGPVFDALQDSSKRDTALAAIETAFADPQMDPRFQVIARAVLGDDDGALRVALELAESGQFYEMDFLFLEELESLRQSTGFEKLMVKLGVRQYWDENECVWSKDKVRC
jgi:DNA-binding winged helix-turn-helix (wHTH) protein/Tfp pilus assembly protein PilF